MLASSCPTLACIGAMLRHLGAMLGHPEAMSRYAELFLRVCFF